MGSYSRPHSFSSVLLVACFTVGGALCAGADRHSRDELATRLAQLEEMWKAEDKRGYYEEAVNVANAIAAHSASGIRGGLADDLLKSLLSKEATSLEMSNHEVAAMNFATSSVLSDHTASMDDRHARIRGLARFLGKVRKETVPNYTPKPSYYNVSPPPDVVGFSGMAPKDISDPVARAKYEASIQKNQENMSLNERQYLLQKSERQLAKPILTYMLETFCAEEKASPLVAECIESAKLTDEEKKKVEDVVGSVSRKGKGEGVENVERDNSN